MSYDAEVQGVNYLAVRLHQAVVKLCVFMDVEQPERDDDEKFQ